MHNLGIMNPELYCWGTPSSSWHQTPKPHLCVLGKNHKLKVTSASAFCMISRYWHSHLFSFQLYGRKGSWEDPADWVVDSYPWLPSSSQDWPSLLRLRPEDVGFDGYNLQTAGTKGTQSSAQSDVEGDPLVREFLHLEIRGHWGWGKWVIITSCMGLDKETQCHIWAILFYPLLLHHQLQAVQKACVFCSIYGSVGV